MKVAFLLSLAFLLFPFRVSGQQTISGNVTVNVVATDASGIASVQVLIDGTISLGTLTTPTTLPSTYSFPWSTPTTSNGSHTLTAKAIDVPGNIGTASLAVTVSNGPPPDTIPPTVTFITPIANAIVTGKINVQTTSNDNIGVSQMQLYIRGLLRKTVNSNLLTYNWNTAPDKKFSPISLTTTSIDSSGNLASQTINVSIR